MALVGFLNNSVDVVLANERRVLVTRLTTWEAQPVGSGDWLVRVDATDRVIGGRPKVHLPTPTGPTFTAPTTMVPLGPLKRMRRGLLDTQLAELKSRIEALVLTCPAAKPLDSVDELGP